MVGLRLARSSLQERSYEGWGINEYFDESTSDITADKIKDEKKEDPPYSGFTDAQWQAFLIGPMSWFCLEGSGRIGQNNEFQDIHSAFQSGADNLGNWLKESATVTRTTHQTCKNPDEDVVGGADIRDTWSYDGVQSKWTISIDKP